MMPTLFVAHRDHVPPLSTVTKDDNVNNTSNHQSLSVIDQPELFMCTMLMLDPTYIQTYIYTHT